MEQEKMVTGKYRVAESYTFLVLHFPPNRKLDTIIRGRHCGRFSVSEIN